MATAAERRRNKKKNRARERAETHSSGFQGTVLTLPEGVKYFQPKEGTVEFDVIPFIVGKGNPKADPDELYYERTFYKYRNIGTAPKDYIANHKTFETPCPIADWVSKEKLKERPDVDMLKSLQIKERQVFLILPVGATQIHLWEESYHGFGKLLDSRINNAPKRKGWDWFYFDNDEGMRLSVTFEKQSGSTPNGGTFTWMPATAIDFEPRGEPLPEFAIAENHGICLDDLLVQTPYDELKNIFLGIPEGGDAPADGGSPTAGRSKPVEDKTEKEAPKEEAPKAAEKPKPEPEPEPEVEKPKPMEDQEKAEKDSLVEQAFADDPPAKEEPAEEAEVVRDTEPEPVTSQDDSGGDDEDKWGF